MCWYCKEKFSLGRPWELKGLRVSKADILSVSPLSTHSDKGLMPEIVSFKNSLRWPIHFINSFDKTGLSWSIPDWRSTTEICPLLNGSLSWSWTHIHSNYIFQSQYQWIGSLNHKYKLSKYCTVSNQELVLISGSKSNSWPRIRSHYPSKHRRRHHRTEEKSWRTKTRGTIPIRRSMWENVLNPLTPKIWLLIVPLAAPHFLLN